MKVYFKTEQVGNNTYYGYNLYMDETMSDSLYGVMFGTKEEVLNQVTKNMLKRNQSVLNFDKLITLKYENLDMTKQMVHTIKYDKSYQTYKDNNVSLMISPSVFLSDNIPMYQLEQGMMKYKMMHKYYTKDNSKNI